MGPLPAAVEAVSGGESVAAVDVAEAMGRLGVALAGGLLVGLQRQYAERASSNELVAGARSFALIGLAGGLSALLAEQFASPLIIAIGLATVGGVVAIGYLAEVRDGDRGATTEVAALVIFLAGVLAGIGDATVAVAVAVATASLLALKPVTRSFVSRLDATDVTATLQFAVLVAIVLPILPREPIGPSPFDAASPFKIGLMVVFILGLSFLGYVLIQIVGPERGVELTGVLGGLVSSTAVTLTMSERSREGSGLLRALATAILLAWGIMYARVLVEVAVVNPELLRSVWLPIGAGGLVVLLWAAGTSRRRHSSADPSTERFTNPFRLGPAIQLGLLYGVVLIGSKALATGVGDAGVYLGAIASGLADVDAIAISMAELSRGAGSVPDDTAADAIVLATASNTLVKGGLVVAMGSRALRRTVGPAVLAAVAVSVPLALVT